MSLGVQVVVLMLPGVLLAGMVFVWVKTSSDADRDGR
jgi:hypothetical protein